MTMTFSGDGTITGLIAGGLPNSTVQQADLATGVAGTGPAFSAYLSATQTGISNSTWTKALIDTKEFDTATAFSTVTNRFTPQVAGYYQVCGSIQHNAATVNPTFVGTSIYKNGSSWKQTTATGNTTNNGQEVACLVYLNGSTDYIELYGYMAGATNGRFDQGSVQTFFQANLVRAA